MGYSLTQSAYICLDVATSRVFISRHVEFVESVFSFASLTQNSSSESLDSSLSNSPSASLVLVFNRSLTLESTPCTDPSPATAINQSPTQEQNHDISDTPPTEHSVSTEQAPVASVPNTHSMITRAKNNIQKPNPKYGLTAVLHEVELENHTEALKDEKW